MVVGFKYKMDERELDICGVRYCRTEARFAIEANDKLQTFLLQ